MKFAKYLALIAPILAALSVSALAQVPTNQIHLGTPNYGGTGCPLGTVSATLSPDAQELSVLFSAFQAEAGGSSGKTVDRKACSIAIPVFVPGGFSVSVIKTDYRGYYRLPMNASATFDLEYFFAQNSAGPTVHKSFVGATDGNFTLSNSVIATANVWSACGDSVNLRTNTNIAVQTNRQNEQAMMTIDSADISAGVVYQLQWRQCSLDQQPTPYPTATPYNPYPQPTPYPYPTPYNPYPQPTPYPTPVLYPTPPPLGPCMINSYLDTRGFLVYMVKDGTGRVLGNSVMYAQAISIAESAQQQGFCVGIENNAPNPGAPNPYPAPPIPPYNPNPFPNSPPNYPPNSTNGQSSCQIMPGGNASGQRFYRVIDSAGRIVYNTPDYNEAVRITRTTPACF